MTDIVLVHGAWHSAAQFTPLTAELTARGHRALAVDLLGHGGRARFPAGWLDRDPNALATARSPLADLTLDAVARDLVATLRRFPGPPVVLAHSMGGAVATRAAELAPETVAGLVYLAAFVPTRLRTAGAYLGLPEAATTAGADLFLGDPAALGAVRIDPRCADPGYRDTLRETYFTDLDDESFAAVAAGLTPDQPLSFVTSPTGATAHRWGTLPRTYVRTTRDRALPVALQDMMIADAEALAPGVRTVTIDAGHAAFATHPAEVADTVTGR